MFASPEFTKMFQIAIKHVRKQAKRWENSDMLDVQDTWSFLTHILWMHMWYHLSYKLKTNNKQVF